MKKRVLAMALVAAMAGTMLTGCGGNGGNSSNTGSDAGSAGTEADASANMSIRTCTAIRRPKNWSQNTGGRWSKGREDRRL